MKKHLLLSLLLISPLAVIKTQNPPTAEDWANYYQARIDLETRAEEQREKSTDFEILIDFENANDEFGDEERLQALNDAIAHGKPYQHLMPDHLIETCH